MNQAVSQSKKASHVEQVANAVLYEGYILYPYRASATKNQQRWNFGALCPPAYALAQKGTEHSFMQTQCLAKARQGAKLTVNVRFLQLSSREVARHTNCQSSTCVHIKNDRSECFEVVPALELEGQLLQTWQEAAEREVGMWEVDLNAIREQPKQMAFSFPASRSTEDLSSAESGRPRAMFIRTQEAIEGAVEISATEIPTDGDRTLVRLSIVIRNTTAFKNAQTANRNDALMRSTVSTHTIVEIERGSFVSLLDPPDEYKMAAAECVNIGTYPVLVGEGDSRDCILSSPIILYDYPQIAAQSAGDLYDGTEIDEILTLRIMTLSDEEKREMRSVDERARQLLERTETMQREELMKLHGVMKRT